MDQKELFRRALDQSTKVILAVQSSQYSLPTPDSEWHVKQLANHMLYELSWIPEIVKGMTLDEVGDRYEGDLMGNNLHYAWQAACVRANKAVADCNLDSIAHLSYGDVKVRDYLAEAASDQLIHAWDLGVATHQKVNFDQEVANEVYERILPQANSMSASGLFAPPVPVAGSADLQTKLLALYGRDSSKWLH